MNKTKICCLSLDKSICDALSKTFEVYVGSLGKLVDVKDHNRQYGETHLLPNHDFPQNVHEYDIFISDLANYEIVKYKEDEHQKNNIVGETADYFISSPPSTIFNPIPFSCMILKDKTISSQGSRPIINVIFQFEKQEFNYTIHDIATYSTQNDSHFKETNYSLTKDFTDETIYGNEILLCDPQIAYTLFEQFANEIKYHQTFEHPTIWDNNTHKSIPDDSFIPLLKNKHGQIISYIWISDKEVTFMLPQLESKKKLLDILFKEVLYKHYSEYFPEVETISWKNKAQYYLPNRQDLESRKHEIIKKYEEDIENIEKSIRENNQKYEFLHNILTETGDTLVKNVIEYLKWLGFDNAIEKDKSATDGLFEEDIQIDLGVKGLLIIEVKGLNGTSKDSECSQISKIRHRRCKERNRFDVYALYIVNNERNVEPLKRTIPPFNDNQIQDAINDDRGLMYTWQLFNLYVNIENGFISKEDARNCFIQTGLVGFTPTLKELGTPYKFYQNHTVICVELNNNTIHVGDTLAYEKVGRYYPITITEIQQDEKPIKEVSDGKVGIKVNEKVPEIQMLYLKKTEQ